MTSILSVITEPAARYRGHLVDSDGCGTLVLQPRGDRVTGSHEHDRS